MRVEAAFAGLVAISLVARGARAEDPHERAIGAFESARRHMEAGDCASAIPFLEESLRHEPTVGARFSYADCTIKTDPYAAWWHLRAAAVLAFLRHDDRFSVAQERAAALAPSLARIGIDVPLATVETPGFELALDGKPVDRFHVAGGVIVAPPGDHIVEARDGKGRHFKRTVTTSGRDAVLVKIVLEDAPPALSTTRTVEPSSGTGRTLGFVVGGAGLAAIAVGAGFGIAAIQNGSELDRVCNGDSSTCTGLPDRVDPVREAGDTNATVATVLFAAGAALVVTGAVFFFTSKPTRGAQTAVLRW